jgi:hypothetical protein
MNNEYLQKSIEDTKGKILKFTNNKSNNNVLNKHFDNLIRIHETILESLYKDLYNLRENKINKILENI